MKELFCSYSQAKELKELGFDLPCLAYYYSEEYKGNDDKSKLYYHLIQSHERISFNGQVNSYKDFGLWYIEAPLKQQVFSFALSKYNRCCYVKGDYDEGKFLGYCGVIEDDNGYIETETYITYTEAENELINLLIKCLK